MLRTLDLAGAIVTVEAAGCSAGNAGRIRQQPGHYLLAVKDDHPPPHAAVGAAFDRACEADRDGANYRCHASFDRARGRREGRYVTVRPDPVGSW